jgi:hypothetical protein
MSEVNMGTLYDFNKNAMASFEPIDIIQFNRMLNSIADTMIDACENCDQHYWMLLCHDRRDYTLFNIVAASNMDCIIYELKPTLENRGKILDIELQDTGAYEIWIRDYDTDENFAYYLFQYDAGVIEVNN